MIQRIQSVYLLMGALALVGLLLVDVVWQNPAVERYGWLSTAILVLGATAAFIGLIALFLYRDRKQQRRVVLGAQLATVALLAVLVGGFALGQAMPVVLAAGVAGYAGLLLPVLAYVLYFFARRAIQKDIDLVRSMDRLR